MPDIKIQTVNRTADSFMVAGAAFFFFLRDKDYFGRAVNDNPKKTMRQFLIDTQMLIRDVARLLRPEENNPNQ